jgi:hypothetical protein
LEPLGEALAREKLTVYNQTGKTPTALDEQAQKLYGGRFNVVNVNVTDNESTWEQPKILNRHRAKAIDESGHCVTGKVSLMFISLADGHAAFPITMSSTEPDISRFVATEIERWNMRPARLGSRAVNSVETTIMHFDCDE